MIGTSYSGCTKYPWAIQLFDNAIDLDLNSLDNNSNVMHKKEKKMLQVMLILSNLQVEQKRLIIRVLWLFYLICVLYLNLVTCLEFYFLFKLLLAYNICLL